MANRQAATDLPPPAPPMPTEDVEVLSDEENQLDDPYLDPDEVWSPLDAALEEVLDAIPFPFGDDAPQSQAQPPDVVPPDPEMEEAEAEAAEAAEISEAEEEVEVPVAPAGRDFVDLEAEVDAAEAEAELESKEADQETLFAIFVDELQMPRRPCMEPSNRDCEVFAKVPPMEEEELRKHLSFYGEIEHLTVLRTDDLSEPKGYAYIQFKTHAEADTYIGVEGPDVQWSEAERALRGKASIYGMDMFDWFHGEWGSLKKDHLARMGVTDGWVLSAHPPHMEKCGDVMALPPSIGKQLHFYVSCRPSKLEDVKKTLGYILEDFHEDVLANEVHPPMSKFLGGKPVPISRKRRLAEKEQRRALMAARDVELEPVPAPKRARHEAQSEAEAFQPVSAGKSLIWDPARGTYVEEDIPEDLQGLLADQLPPPVNFSSRPAAKPQRLAAPAASSAPQAPPDTLIKEGEMQIGRARNYHRHGFVEDSFRSYQQGIEKLLKALTTIESQDANNNFTILIHDLKHRLDLYLSEAERVQLLCTVGDRLGKA